VGYLQRLTERMEVTPSSARVPLPQLGYSSTHMPTANRPVARRFIDRSP
jgi:hypothetical protein